MMSESKEGKKMKVTYNATRIEITREKNVFVDGAWVVRYKETTIFPVLIPENASVLYRIAEAKIK